jgi:hypothetical protein
VLKQDQPGCAVKSGDKPAAAQLYFLPIPNTIFMSLKLLNNQIKPSETRAICGLSCIFVFDSVNTGLTGAVPTRLLTGDTPFSLETDSHDYSNS